MHSNTRDTCKNTMLFKHIIAFEVTLSPFHNWRTTTLQHFAIEIF